MKRTFTSLFLFLFLLSSSSAQVSQADSLVLVAIYNATDGPNWTKQENWLSGAVGTWEGITIDNQRVTGIKFSQTGLKDTLPDEIYQLDSLRILDINESALTFGFSNQVADWSALRVIRFSNGQISGTFDLFCSNSRLTEIRFFNIPITGTIPSCLKNLPFSVLNASSLNLDSEPLPDFFGEMTGLTSLSLTRNSFTGSIPASWCNLTNLIFLVLSDNNLTGTVPDCLNPEGLYSQFLIGKNNFEGSFPASVIKAGLTIVQINDNDFTGNLDQWPAMSIGTRLDLQNNRFSGTFNGNVINLSNIRTINISNNQFEELANVSVGQLLNTLQVQGNVLNFTDLEQISGPQTINTFLYQPQSRLNDDQTINIQIGGNETISCDAGGSMTTYQWFKDNQLLASATSSNFEILNAQMADAGIYYCEAINDSFPDLTLRTGDFTIQVGSVSTHSFEDRGWQLYPNPAQDYVVIDLGNDLVSNLEQLHLSDLSGRLYQSDLFSKTDHQLRLSTTGLSPGLYFLKLMTENEIFWSKLLVD